MITIAVYITGDTHGNYSDFISRFNNIHLDNNDVVVIVGDFCFLWSDETLNKHIADLTKFPCTICYVEGNHDDYEKLKEYDIEEWNGGKVQRIAENIYHLMRGNVFTIENKKFFAMGGAFSDGRIEANKGRIWWDDEIPSAEEFDTAVYNLKKHDYKVDYVITHTAPKTMIHRMRREFHHEEDRLTEFLEWIFRDCSYKYWFCGHFHFDETFEEYKFHVMNRNVIKIE